MGGGWCEGVVGSLSFNVQGWGGISPNSDPFGQTEKGGKGWCKNWAFFFDVIIVWSLTPGDLKNSNSRKGLALSSHIKNQNHYF